MSSSSSDPADSPPSSGEHTPKPAPPGAPPLFDPLRSSSSSEPEREEEGWELPDDDTDPGRHREFHGRGKAVIVAFYGCGKITHLKDGTVKAVCDAPGHGNTCTRSRTVFYKALNPKRSKCLGLLAALLDKGADYHDKRSHVLEGNAPTPQERLASRLSLRAARDAGDNALRALFEREPKLGKGSDDEPDVED